MLPLFLTVAVAAQPPPEPPGGGGGKFITGVEFEGLSRSTPAFAADLVRLRAGDPYDPRTLDEAVERLLRTGRYLSVRYSTADEPDGVRVTFVVAERALLTVVRFAGNHKFNERKLRDQAGLKLNEPVDRFALRDAQEAILRLYREAGYSDVGVSFNEDEVDRSGEVLYTIEEGRRTRVRKIVFEGNASIRARELKKQVETKPAFWFFRAGALEKDRLETDVAQVQKYYRDQGFLDARVSVRQEEIKASDLRLVFTIEEGTRYTVETLTFTGQTFFSTEDLERMSRTRVGGYIVQPDLDADVRAIRDAYGEAGYIYATVRAVRVFSDAPGLVRVTIEISEGEQFRVGRVVVRGNARTKDKVVRRALNLYPPDDLFNLTEAREAEKRLLETRVFSSARVIPVGDEPGVRDVVVDVQESEKTGDFLFGVGVTSNSGLVGSIVLDLQNFDIADRPKTWKEFFKFKAFHGAGQRLRVELQPGTEVSRFRIDFTEPYLFDKPLRFDTGLFYFERDRDGYAETRVGSTVSLGKRFERGRLAGWSGELALSLEQVTIDDLDLFTARDIRDDEGDHFLPSVKGTLLRDRTDSRFIPTTGDRLRVSYEQFFGDYSFGKLNAGYSWYKTLRTDALDRKSVLNLRAEGGIIVGDAPVFERYYAGGIGSIRGFKFRGVGERAGLDDNNVGGDYLVLLGAEYSFPVYGDNVRGHVFLDTGTAGSGAYRAAVGVGVRLTIDLLGPLPLEFNIALPIASDADDDEQVFSFVVGSLF
ncbi:MAG: outer membrane protein assembly factor BamA [Planctomycetes bacterium]|nr:outer membrane protein assembly factor BamA [Planctomycetota bacterium]